MTTGVNREQDKECDNQEEIVEEKSNGLNGKYQFGRFIAYRAVSGTASGRRFESRKVRTGNVKPDVPSRLSRVSLSKEE